MKHHNRFLVLLILSVLLHASAISAAKTDSENKIKVACVGNSITYGYGVNDRLTESYPAQLGRLLGAQYEVGNFGRNGTTLLKKGHRPYVVQEEFNQAISFKPDIVVIHLGVNDTDLPDYNNFSDDFITDYLALIDTFKCVNPDIRVILANLSPLPATHRRFKSGVRAWRDSIRKDIAVVADLSGSELIDFGDLLLDREEVVFDAIHPDVRGHTMMAHYVRNAITGDFGGLQMPSIYSDGMVLQRYMPLKISGTANAGDTVTVSLGKNKLSDVSNNRGEWNVTLPPMPEGTGLTMTVTDGKTTIVYNDVALGEVWLASGQSNMAFPLSETSTFDEVKNQLNDPMLRLYDMKPKVRVENAQWDEEKTALIDNLDHYKPTIWKQSDSLTAAEFSGVAWYFGKMLRDSLKVPVGIINNSIGGSPTEAWISVEALEHNEPDILVNWMKNDMVQPYVRRMEETNLGPDGNKKHRHPFEPSYLFSTGVRPLNQYPIAGVIWYQGESNDHNIEIHERLFPLLVDNWRSYWNKPEMPFIFAQLTSIIRPSWPKFRDSQRRMSESIPGVAMAVISDVGDSLNIHPLDKKSVGERMGRQALNRVYSMNNVTPQGPTIKKVSKIAPGTLLLTFDYAEGLTTADGQAPRTFEVAEFDRVYQPAEKVEILDNNTIKITCMSIENPRFVRYGWQPFTRANLVNADGLPASTFKMSVAESPVVEDGIEAGISAPYVGMANGCVIRAGGCNFPSNPMAPGSQKKFYQGIYALTSTPDGGIKTEQIGLLPFPMAYGMGVTVPEGLVLIGGTTPAEALSTVFLLTVNDEGKAELKQLPSFPYSVDNTSAAYLEGKVYVAGGNIDGKPSNDLYCLDMADTAKGWTKLASFPGNPRVQPVLAGSKDAKGSPTLYMWGGFAGKGDGREASLDTDGYAYNVAKKKWNKIAAPTDKEGVDVSTGGGVAATLPDGKIVVAGGVNKDIFLNALRNQAPDYLSHPIEWYRFNDLVLVFDPVTEKWAIADQTPEAARAGAGAVVTSEGEVLLIGGELKPRIRTADVLRIALK